MAATVTTSDEDIVISRDYVDNFAIKETAMTKLGEKYFPESKGNNLNIGLLGLTLEHIGNITEDSYNTMSVLIHEAFPNKAIIPESIYSHAAIFQIDNVYTKCAKCTFVMLLQQDEVLEKGETSGNKTRFFIDKRMIFSVEDKPFTLDYDIEIDATRVNPNNGSNFEYVFTAKWVFEHRVDDILVTKNYTKMAVSDANDPYLKIRKLPNGTLILQFDAHQIERTEMEESITKNTRVNFPVMTFNFDNGLAGFDIFYKAPSDKTWTQLDKLIKFSLPIKTPFCYYRLKDEQTLEITFSTRDGYFQPDFNSEIRIVMYTTLGKDAEFPTYTGTHVEIIPFTDKYPYNEEITIAIRPISDCAGASEKMSLEALQSLAVEGFSTATEISSESDLMTYFYNFKYRYGTEILVIKRRDDVTERLYSAFLVIKNEDYIYPTNTLYTDLTFDQFDSNTNGNRYILQPGHVFTYKGSSKDTVLPAFDDDGKPIMCYDTEKVQELIESEDFAFMNPYMVCVNRSPNVVGLYKTIVSQNSILDYETGNDNVIMQVILPQMKLTRGLKVEDYHEQRVSPYLLQVSVIPSTSTDQYIDKYYVKDGYYVRNESVYDKYDMEGNLIEEGVSLDDAHALIKEDLLYVQDNITDRADLRIFAVFKSLENVECGVIEMLPTGAASEDATNVTFSAKVVSNDKVTSQGEVPFINCKRYDGRTDPLYVPMVDSEIIYYVLYKTSNTSNPFTSLYDDLEGYEVINRYSNKSEKTTFVKPMNMMRSNVIFNTIEVEDGTIANCNISLLPMVKADIIEDDDNFNVFIDRITSQYNYLNDASPILRNNTNLDVKFYNTYGRSNNYLTYDINDNEEVMDRVNLTIAFQVYLNAGADEYEVKRDLKSFIKAFIEKINSTGANDFYVSNLIKAIENSFGEVHHLKFLGINDYDTGYQTIGVRQPNLTDLTKEERRRYVPEILVANPDDIQLSLYPI